MLCEIATFCPLATNIVENSHGQHQNAMFTFRGKTKGPAAAGECSILHSLIQEHAYLKSLVLEVTMPKRLAVANMQRQLCRKKGKQPKINPRALVLKASKRKGRRLSAWNIFLEENMRGSHQLDKEQYGRAMKNCSRQWKLLDEQSKKRYQVEAHYQQSCREELQSRPLLNRASRNQEPEQQHPHALPAAELATSSLEAVAGTGGCSKLQLMDYGYD